MTTTNDESIAEIEKIVDAHCSSIGFTDSHMSLLDKIRIITDSHKRMRDMQVEFNKKKQNGYQEGYADAQKTYVEEMTSQEAWKLLSKMSIQDIVNKYGNC